MWRSSATACTTSHLINRALVYGATTGAIAAAFFAGIIVLQALLSPITGGSEVAVAISTLVSLALFQPVRRRIQDGVDRRFHRSRYDAARTLDAFGVRLRDEVDLDEVRAELVHAVRETVQPAHASLWLRADRSVSRTVADKREGPRAPAAFEGDYPALVGARRFYP